MNLFLRRPLAPVFRGDAGGEQWHHDNVRSDDFHLFLPHSSVHRNHVVSRGTSGADSGCDNHRTGQRSVRPLAGDPDVGGRDHRQRFRGHCGCAWIVDGNLRLEPGIGRLADTERRRFQGQSGAVRLGWHHSDHRRAAGVYRLSESGAGECAGAIERCAGVAAGCGSRRQWAEAACPNRLR